MHRNATNAVRPPSLVDTLSSGFRTSHRAAAALLVPVLLNVWYWLGPRISLQPLFAWLRSIDPVLWDSTRAQLEPYVPQGQVFDLRVEGLLEERWFFWFWRRLFALVPSSEAIQLWQPTTWYVGGFLSLFGSILALNIIFSLLLALYLLPLADAVRGDTPTGNWFIRVLDTWARIMGIQGLIVVLLLVGGVPLLFLVLGVAYFVPVLGSFLMAVLTATVVWLMFTTSFAYDAVVLNRSNPVRALLSSLLIVRKSFWGVVSLYLLIGVILAGLGVIWRGMETTVVGMLVAVFASAYISTGLATAHLVFYYNRSLVRASES